MSLSIDIMDGQGLSNRVETTCQKHKGDTINHLFNGRSHLYSFTLPLGVNQHLTNVTGFGKNSPLMHKYKY